MNPLFLAIPIFLTLMLVEYIITRRRGLEIYNFSETMSNIFCGLGQVILEGIIKLPIIGLYLFILDYQLIKWNKTFASYLILFILIDFIFYVSHYLGHKVKWMWAIHGVHHQSRHYNFSVGLRMPWFHKLAAFWTPLPLALLGFPLEDYVLVLSLHASLQIWTHTQLFPKRIPYFEWIFVTPAHHRVHHGSNDLYIDKNFAGLLSVWDYLFGTYQPETEKVIYGVKGVEVYTNPLWANLVQFFPRYFVKKDKVYISSKEKIISCSITTFLIVALSFILLNENDIKLSSKIGFVVIYIAILSMMGSWIDYQGQPITPYKNLIRRVGHASVLLLLVFLI